MDRDAITRAKRRRQASEALAFERERAAGLAEQIDEIVAELEGPRVDEEAFARMAPEDAQLARSLLDPEESDAPDEQWLVFGDDIPEDDEGDPREDAEREIARLQEEIAASRRRQNALERYIEALGVVASTDGLPADDLEAKWLAAEPAPRDAGRVRLICVRTAEGVHETPERVGITAEGGVDGDRWASGDRPVAEAQVTLMNVRVAELIGDGGVPLHLSGDNFLVDLDLAEEALPAGTRLRLGDALLEVAALPHTGCKKFRERFGLGALTWVNDHRDRRLRGVNCRVLEAGAVAVGDPVAVEDRAQSEN